MPHNPHKLYEDILQAISETMGFCHGKTFCNFKKDRGLQLIVERELEILGEALKAEVVVADMNDIPLDELSMKKICGEKLALEKIPQVFEFTSRMKVAATGKKTKSLNQA